LTFHYNVNNNVPRWIVTDRHKLTVVLTKLLDNAVKFTEQGEVQLEVSVDENTSLHQLICIVSDTGPGIAKDQQELIFDPFMQIEGGFTRRHSGMGMGLSICRRLASSLKGTLKVYSGLGEGSRFILSIPLEIGEPTHLKTPDYLASADLPILVVEDNIVNQKVIAKMLKKLGFESLVANHGEEALDILRENTISLVLMDLQMPVMDGFTCTSAIRKSDSDYKDIPIIAVTANVMDQDRARCTEVKMNDFLEKPLKLNVLENCLSQYVKLNNNGQ
jgi:CheY-like chemotaxis protein